MQKLRLLATVSSRGETAALLRSAGDAVLVQREVPRLLVLCCPCGCGEQFPVNLDPRAGPAWRLYRSKGGAVSLYPSVWRESGCLSHYIIWRDQILLFGARDDDLFGSPDAASIELLMTSLIPLLPSNGLATAEELAEPLGAIPWDVLTACRTLVRQGKAIEGIGAKRGSFGLRR